MSRSSSSEECFYPNPQFPPVFVVMFDKSLNKTMKIKQLVPFFHHWFDEQCSSGILDPSLWDMHIFQASYCIFHLYVRINRIS